MPLPFIDPSTVPYFASFLFVFAVVYGALFSSKVFSQKGVNAVIAIAFGLISAAYPPFVNTVYTYLPIAAGILAVLFFVQVVRKTFGGGPKQGTKYDALPPVIGLGISLLLAGVLWKEIYYYLAPLGIGSNNLLWAVGIVVVVLIFWLVYKHSEQ